MAVAPDLAAIDPFLDRLLGLPAIHSAGLSPDGKWLAWTWAKLGPTTQLWLQPADGGVPRCLLDDGRDCDYIIWSRDSRSVIVGQSTGGDERISLLQVFLDGAGEVGSRAPRRLTPEAPGCYLHGGQLLADNRHLVYAANVDPETGVETETALVFVHDIESGERRAIARPQKPAFMWPVVSPDDELVLYERQDLDAAGCQLWLAAIDGSFDREIVNVGAADKVDGAWTPDGAGIVLVAEGKAHRRVGLWHRDGGAIDWLVEDPSRNVEDAVWLRRTRCIVVEEANNARAAISLLDPATGREEPFSPGSGTYDPIGFTAAGYWLCWHYAAEVPARLLLLESAAPFAEVTELARHPERAGFARAELASAEDYRWRSLDGLEIQGWLYRTSGEPRGTILLVHGGPTHHDEDAFDPEIQYYVACGFSVLTPNYRGSTGFSLAFQEAIKAEGWGGPEQDDIRTGAEALIRDGIAHAGRIGITGTSYGGYSAWWAITHFPPEVIAAAVPICGMTDLAVDYETTRPDLRPYSEEMMGGSPQTVAQRFRDRSPINFVSRIRGRLLIVQGDNDPNVTPRNVTDVITRLRDADVSFESLNFADEGHGISRPANQRVLYRRIARFFAEAFA